MNSVTIETSLRHPVDCNEKMINGFIKMVMAGGEVPFKNLEFGVPRADRLFFTLVDGKFAAVSALRKAQTLYHKHLFESAGVPQMYNPDSLESCWLYILPAYRGSKGIWPAVQQAQLDYLLDRPSHGIYRAENKLLTPNVEKTGYLQIGKDFTTPQSSFVVRLVARNHDPVYNPKKRLTYALLDDD